MPVKVQIVIHLIRFAPQSIIWAGTKDTSYSLGEVVNYMIINPHGVGVKCPDDEINEQRILTAPAITLSDHDRSV